MYFLSRLVGPLSLLNIFYHFYFEKLLNELLKEPQIPDLVVGKIPIKLIPPIGPIYWKRYLKITP